MAAKGKEKAVIEDGDNEEQICQRSAEQVPEKYEMTIKGWEQTKAQLRGGHKSIVDSILHADVGGTSENRVEGNDKKTVQEMEKANDDNNVRGNVEGVIEEMGWADYYNDIEFLGFDENVERDEEENDVSHKKCNRSEDDDDSDDDSFIGQSFSSDTEESLFDEFEVGELVVGEGSDIDGDGLGDSEDEPLLQLTVLQEAEAVASRPSFVVGMTFKDKKELKRAIDKYAIRLGVNLKIVRSDKKTVRVVCEEGCPFTLYASTNGLSVGWQVKSLVYEHMCARVYENPRASTTWLAEYFKDKVQEDPQFKTKEMKKEMQRDLKVSVSIHKCKRAKKKIMEEMEGSFKDEFGKLEAYCNELKLSNPGSDVCVEVSTEALDQGIRIFKRMYLSFNASKVGWKEGCRPLIGVDGTFLKGKSRGILLTAVGVDANDSLFPLALALVEKETALNWSWFLQWLRNSLDLEIGETVTIISDMQKGLANAIGEVLPRAEHRFCARHIYANWSKKWRGNEFKKKFFTCAWSTFVEEFKDNLTCLGSLNKEAAEDVVSYNVNSWVRSYFTARCKSWVVDNNMSESFNAWIYEYRFLPVIKMIDGIRLKMMAKWAESESNVCGWKSDFSTKCMDLFESNRFLAVDCRVFFNGDDGYEVVEGQDRHLVYLGRQMCTCRAWDLTGIPCQHAICAMYHAKIDPKSQISHYYHKDTYLRAYRTKLQPVRGKKFWDTEKFLPMHPPIICKLPGRPPTKRTRTDEAGRRRKKSASTREPTDLSASQREEQVTIERLTRRGKTHKCTRCKKPGHNKKSCKELPEPTQLTQEAPTQPQSSHPGPSNTQASSTSYNRATRSSTRKTRGACGFGIRYDETTGSSVYNPGLTSEQVIEYGSGHEYMGNDADPQIRFPIPNERELRSSRGGTSGNPTDSRCIKFHPDPINATPPSDLPFQPRGLQWRGQPCVTTSQLMAQSRSEIQKKKGKGKAKKHSY